MLVVEMKDKKNLVVKIFFIIMLLGSLCLYFRLYIYEDKNYHEMPSNIVGHIWYKNDNTATLKFVDGRFEYRNRDNRDILNECHKYDYDKNNKVVNLDCDAYTIKINEVTKYHLEISLKSERALIQLDFYNDERIVNYLVDKAIDNLSDEEIEEKISFNGENKYNDNYKNVQISKLSIINEISIDTLLSMKNKKDDAIILLINKGWNNSYYDFIPVFLNWRNLYKNFNYYYIDANKLTSIDRDLLINDEDFKGYLNDDQIEFVIFKEGKYSHYYVNISNSVSDGIFDCRDDECNLIIDKVWNEDASYDKIDELLSNSDVNK